MLETGDLHSPCPLLYVNVKGPRKGHSTGAAFSLNIEYSSASPVIKLHRLGKASRPWQKATKEERKKLNKLSTFSLILLYHILGTNTDLNSVKN